MDHTNKHKGREHSWHPQRSWKRRYFSDLKKMFY